MNALSTVKSSTPALASRQLDTLISRFTNALETKPGTFNRKTIPASSAPTAEERQALAERHLDLESRLRPIDEHALTRSVATLRAAFPAANDGHENAMLTVKLYVSALSSFPEWAVNEACRKALTGSLPANPGFAPTPPQMAQACRAVVVKFADEKAKLESILSAEVVKESTPESRERAVEQYLQGLRPQLVAREGQPSQQEDPEEVLKRLAAMKDAPVAIGGALAKKIEQMKAGE